MDKDSALKIIQGGKTADAMFEIGKKAGCYDVWKTIIETGKLSPDQKVEARREAEICQREENDSKLSRERFFKPRNSMTLNMDDVRDVVMEELGLPQQVNR